MYSLFWIILGRRLFKLSIWPRQRGISRTDGLKRTISFEIKYWRFLPRRVKVVKNGEGIRGGMKNERHEMYEIPEGKASKFLRRINIFTVHDEYVHPSPSTKRRKSSEARESRVVCLCVSRLPVLLAWRAECCIHWKFT